MLYNKARKRKGMKHMNIKAAIWDLDGTLLNTLDDLAASTNAALTENGLPTHTVDEVRMFVGNGIGKLIERALPDGQDNPKFQAVYDAFVAHYGAHSRDHTKPYDGILPMLDALAAKGVKLAIVSNKIDFAVKALSRDYFRQSDAGGDWRRSEPQTQARAGQRAGSHASDGRDEGRNRVHRRFGCGCGNGAQRGRGLLRGELGVSLGGEPERGRGGADRGKPAGAAGHAGGAVKPPYDAALVLGVELGANDAPTDELARRVTAAAEVYHRGACAKLVLCGGKLPGHRLAEAYVMARMMTALGVSEEALILEDRSQDTMENCRNAANLIGRKNRVLVVTSDYHLSRAVMTARRVGFDADGLAAKLPDGDVKRRLMEACYIFDLLMGWQDEGKGRPAWTYRLFARVFGEN